MKTGRILNNRSLIFAYIIFAIVCDILFKYSSGGIFICSVFNCLSIAVSVLFIKIYKSEIYPTEYSVGRQLIKGIVVGLGLFCLISLLLKVFFEVDIKVNTSIHPGKFMEILVFELVVAVAEELKYRKILIASFTSFFKATNRNYYLFSLLLSTVFGFLHVYMGGNYIQFTSAFIVSMVIYLAIGNFNKNNIISAITIHYVYDVLVGIMIYTWK